MQQWPSFVIFIMPVYSEGRDGERFPAEEQFEGALNPMLAVVVNFPRYDGL